MSTIPPSSSDYQSKVTQQRLKEIQDKAYQKILQNMGMSETAPVGYVPKSDAKTSVPPLGQTPVLEAGETPVTVEFQVAGLNRMADELQKTPQTSISLFQAESLMNASKLSKLDPNLAAALIGRIQEKTTPKEFAQAIEDGLAQYLNPDGTVKPEFQAALNGDGLGALVMKDNVPNNVKTILNSGTPPTADSEQTLRDYLDECLSKGWGEGKLSPMFALMLLLTQYNNMRSMMDEKLAMVRQQAIKAGYNAQVADMMSKAYVALGSAIFTAVLTGASVLVQVKGTFSKPKPSADDAADLQQLEGEKGDVGKEIATVKEDITDSKTELQKFEKYQEIKHDLDTNPDAAYYYDETRLDEFAMSPPQGLKAAPSDVCDPQTGEIDLVKLTAKVNENVNKIPDVKKQLDGQERKLDQLQRRLDMKEHSIEEKNRVIDSKHNTNNQATVTALQGLIQFGVGMSQFGQSIYDTFIKKLEYQVTEDTFYQRQLGTNEQQSDQSISSLRQSAAQAEESSSGTLGSIGRNIV